MIDNSIDFVNVLINNWEVVFIYGFKYLRDISENLRKLELDIALLKQDNKRRASDFSQHHN